MTNLPIDEHNKQRLIFFADGTAGLKSWPLEYHSVKVFFSRPTGLSR